MARANPNTGGVMSVPGAVLTPWVAKVKGLLTNFMPGQQAGHAIADVLFGQVVLRVRVRVGDQGPELVLGLG